MYIYNYSYKTTYTISVSTEIVPDYQLLISHYINTTCRVTTLIMGTNYSGKYILGNRVNTFTPIIP